MARILYLSCHSILEFDEISLLHELGHEVFSPGAYVEPDNPGNNTLRPSVPGLKYSQDILDKFHAIGQTFPGEDNKDHLTKELVDCFDIIIVMHLPRWIKRNWKVLKGKRVIWRTIGQSITSVEQSLMPFRRQGLEIVRYSPMERNIPGYIGGDALIRFYKDPKQYKNWNGNKNRIITFAQNMKDRSRACNYLFFEKVTRPFDRHLFGPGNKDTNDWTSGEVTYAQLLQELCDNRIYFYTGTHPASYTLSFIEALMTGIPIVAIGPTNGNASYFKEHNLYEIPYIIRSGVNGFCSDNIDELQRNIKRLFHSKDLAKAMSINGRVTAIELFGKEVIKQRWKSYLGE